MSTKKKERDIVLEVKNLKTYFETARGSVKAVDDISFKVHRGETVGIVGESGSGKSVTSLSMMQLIPSPPGRIAGGEIWLNSPHQGLVDLTKLSEKNMQRVRGDDISMVFQEPMTSLNPVFTCGDQVMETIMLHRKVSREEAKKRTLNVFKVVQLPRPEDIFNSYPHQISGGQKQRVMIAMAMSCEPELLIADEPTTALDVTVQENILRVLNDLSEENNIAIMFITHDLGVIAEFADQIIVMYQGKIVEQGPVMEIFSNPKHPYTKGLLACRPRLNFKFKELPTITDFMEVDENGTIIEKKSGKFNSVGAAILQNIESQKSVDQRQVEQMKQEVILEVKNLKTYFPVRKGLFGKEHSVVKAVDDVSFKVYAGETLGLVGESGCGKTTLGRTILRLIEPTEGEIIFDGQRINDYKKSELQNLRKKTQIIFQDPYSSLNPRMAIGEAILEPMRVHKILGSDKERKERAYSLLEEVNLNPNYYNRYPHEFSGGQRQRICIARALALNPRFIICDESVSALDVSVQAQVLNLLNRLKENHNFTYIFISHDLSVIKFMADRIIVMNHGKIVEQGYAENIFNNPLEAYTQKLISAIPRGDLEDIRKVQLRRQQRREEKLIYEEKEK